MVSRAILNGWPLVPPSRRPGVAVNILAPMISGTFTVGQTLTLSNGSWIGFPSLQYSVQWLRNGLPIDGATGSTYTLVDADAGSQISAAVIASNPYGNVSATTAASTVSQGGGSAGTFRTAVSTRNGIPTATSTPAAASTNGATRGKHVHRNNASAAAKNLAFRLHAFGYDSTLKRWPTGGVVLLTLSAEIGGVRYQLKQGGSSIITVPADGWVDTDIISTPLGVPVDLPAGATCIIRNYVDQTIGKYGLPSNSGNGLVGLGEYNTFGGTGLVTDVTMSGEGTPANAGVQAVSGWLIGDVPIGTKSALTIDDSKGCGILENGNIGNNSDYVASYSGDDFGNAGYWDRYHRAVGMNGINLSLPSSSATGNGTTTGWAYSADVSKLVDSLSGLKFTDFEIGLGQNEQGSTLAILKASYALVYAKFSSFLLTAADIWCREQTPSAGEAGVAVTGTTYSGTTGVDTLSAANAAALYVSWQAGLASIRKAGANQAGFVGTFPIVAVDNVANTVSYTVASGLTTPTTFGTMFSLFSTGQFQTIPNATNEGYRAQKNAEIVAKTMLPGQTKIFYTRGSVEVTFGGNQVWRTDGTRQKYVADGVHETAAAYAQITLANSRITLPYDPVLVIGGDSQAWGNGGDQTAINAYAAAYVPNPQVQILNDAGAFVTYDPANGKAGVNVYVGDDNHCGMEIGYIRKFLAAYTNTLRIVKRGASGSFQGRPAANKSTGSVTGSISGNILAVTGGTPANDQLIVGGSAPSGTYIMFGAGGANWYVGKLGQAANVNYTVASAAFTRWNVTDSWDLVEGGLYGGHNNLVTNEMQGKLAAALAAMTSGGLSPRIVTWLHVLGTNDGADTTTAAAFQASLTAALSRMGTDFDLSNAQIVLPRCVGTANDATIRAAQAAVKAINTARRKLIDMDSYTRWDGTHWNFAGLDGAGAQAFDVTFGGAAGL